MDEHGGARRLRGFYADNLALFIHDQFFAAGFGHDFHARFLSFFLQRQNKPGAAARGCVQAAVGLHFRVWRVDLIGKFHAVFNQPVNIGAGTFRNHFQFVFIDMMLAQLDQKIREQFGAVLNPLFALEYAVRSQKLAPGQTGAAAQHAHFFNQQYGF